ncbi:MAG: hypothetical protein RI988_3572 [Pseudomonadota bacterium]|jgi:hypothetical protein
MAAWQVRLIPESMIQMTVGARATPAAVVALLGLLILAYGLSALRGRQVDLRAGEGEPPEAGAPRRVAWLLGGGVAFIGLVQVAGFILPAALCALAVARAFDAPLSWRAMLLSLAIAAVFWGVFAGILGVGLGPAVAGWP